MTYKQLMKRFGGPARLARLLGTSKQAINQWGGFVPLGRAYEIESITEGEIKAKDLPTKKRKKHKKQSDVAA